MPTTPNLGYGQQSEQTIDTVNQWMRASDWYNTLIKSFGQQPNNVHLNDQQKEQVMRAAQAQGVIVDEGNMEIDPSGNFNPIGHKLRNTLIVAGLAAATIATMGAAGVFSGAAAAPAAGGTLEGVAAGGAGASTAIPAAGGLLEASTTVPLATGTIAGGTGLAGGAAAAIPVGTTLTSASAIAAAKAAGYTINDAGVVTDAANVPSTAFDYFDPSGSASTRSYADILKYGLPTAGTIVGSLIAANASGNASAAQQKYLEDALAYEKENDLYNRGVAANKVALEAGRYADYTGRISGFVANGQSSNDRMASLLGLPPRPAGTYSPGGAGSSGSSYGTQTPSGVAVSPQLTQRILDNYKSLGLSPTGPGSGPTDSAYYTEKYAETGGDTAANNAYWFGPTGRVATDAQKAGLTFGAPTTPPPTAPTTTPPPVTGAPVARSLVRIRAADGTEQNIPADQVQQYLSRGAAVLGAGV
jgi:hypothetical protein